MVEQQQQTTGLVFMAIKNVMADMAKAGVGKKQTNTQQNFKYRGVDDVMDALAPSLYKHDLVILPSVIEHTLTERQTRSGASVLHALLKLSYEFICPVDGSTKTVGPIFGEAMDSGDKATNKAMAVAYKYLCVQTFCIPITGADDPDSQTHEIAGAPREREHSSGTRSESPSASAPASRSSTTPASKGMEPEVSRPGGMFGYGKKHRETPWNVMQGSALEWFLDADHTPQLIREKIVSELAWRDYEAAKMNRIDEEAKKARELPLSDDIP